MLLTRDKSGRPPVKLSFPANGGAICFDFGLRPPLLSPPELISTGISWFWTSSRGGPNWEESPVHSLPEMRPPTRLNESNGQAFLDDFRDNRSSGEGRDIWIVGIDPKSEQIVEKETDLENSLRKFAREGVGPIQMLFYQEDDGDAVVYTIWPFSTPVRDLVASWLIQPDNIRDLHSGGWKKWQTKYLQGVIECIVSRIKS